MADNGNHPEIRVSEVRRRVPGSGPILILAILFVAATFLRGTSRGLAVSLSDADISKYLADETEAASRAARSACRFSSASSAAIAVRKTGTRS